MGPSWPSPHPTAPRPCSSAPPSSTCSSRGRGGRPARARRRRGRRRQDRAPAPLLRARRASRVLWGDCDALFTPSPLGPLVDIAASHGRRARSRSSPPARRRTRSPRRCCASCAARAVDRSSSRTCTGPTRRRSTCCGCSAGASAGAPGAGRRHATATTSSIARTRCGSCSASSRAATAPTRIAARAALAGAVARARRRRTASTPPRCTGAPAGNPFFVTEALAAGGEELPATVRDAVLARAARLERAGRGACSTRSRSCRARVEPAAARGARRRRSSASTSAWPAACCGAAGRGVAFRHELARVAIEETLAPARARRCTAALARWPRRAASDPARLALPRRGRRRRRGGAALRARRRRARGRRSAPTARPPRSTPARCASPTGGSTAERAELLERRALRVLPHRPARRGDRRRCASALAGFRALGDRCARATSLRRLADILWCPGDATRRAERASEAVAAARAARPDAASWPCAYAQLAAAAHEQRGRARRRRVGRAGARARERARRAASRGPRARQRRHDGRSWPAARGPRHRSSTACTRAARPACEDHVARAYTNLGWAALRQPRVRARRRGISSGGLDYADDPGLDMWRLYLLAYQARAELEQGRWERAGETAARSCASAARPPLPVMLALSILGRLRARRGDPDPWAPLDEALALAPGRELQRLEPVALARAEARGWPATPERASRPRTRGVLGARASAAAHGWARRRARGAGARRAGAARAPTDAARSPSRARSSWRASSTAAAACLDARSAAPTRRRSRWPAPTTRTLLRRALARCSALGAQAAARARRPPAARARRGGVAARPAPDHAREPGAAHRARARGARAGRRRPAQPRHRRAPVPLDQDRRPPRVGDPAQARRRAPAARRRPRSVAPRPAS